MTSARNFNSSLCSSVSAGACSSMRRAPLRLVRDLRWRGKRFDPVELANRPRAQMASWVRGSACPRSLRLRGVARRLAGTAGQHPFERRLHRGRRVCAVAGRASDTRVGTRDGWCRQRPLPRTDASRSRTGSRWVDGGVGGRGPTRVAAPIATLAPNRCSHRRCGRDRGQHPHPYRRAAVQSGQPAPGPRGVACPHGGRHRLVVRAPGRGALIPPPSRCSLGLPSISCGAKLVSASTMAAALQQLAARGARRQHIGGAVLCIEPCCNGDLCFGTVCR